MAVAEKRRAVEEWLQMMIRIRYGFREVIGLPKTDTGHREWL